MFQPSVFFFLFVFFFWEKTFNGGTEISLCLEDGQNYYSDININFSVN